MTREEFDGAITAHYRQVVKMAQTEIRRQRVTSLQGEDVIAEIVAGLLKENRYEKVAFDAGFPIGYFGMAIPAVIVQHIRSLCGETEGAREARAKYHAGDGNNIEQASTYSEIRIIAERVIQAIEDPTKREVARLVYLEGWRRQEALREIRQAHSGSWVRFLDDVRNQLREALKEYGPGHFSGLKAIERRDNSQA